MKRVHFDEEELYPVYTLAKDKGDYVIEMDDSLFESIIMYQDKFFEFQSIIEDLIDKQRKENDV